MTFANGAFNPLPQANPLNTRIYGNISLNPMSPMATQSKFRACKSPEDLQVPNQDVPMYGSDEWNAKYAKQDQLQVPNQDIPPGDQLGGNGFIQNSDRLFRLADGTVVDFKTRKVLYSPNKESSQYWGDPSKTISMESQCWNDEETKLEDLISKIDQYYGRASSGSSSVDAMNAQLDPKSAKYWLQAQQEAEKMKSSMTQQQKDMIADFEHHFPKSRLIEEAKKAAEGRMI